MADRIALDSGAVIKLGDGDPLTRAVLRKCTDEGWEAIVPTPVLAETLRGGAADARVHRILRSRATAITIVGVSEAPVAMPAGGLARRAWLRATPLMR